MAYKQFYLIPIVVTNFNRGFKYMRTNEIAGFSNYSGMDFGNEDQGLVSFNAELVDHDSLVSNPDVFQFPVDLNENVAPVDLAALISNVSGRKFSANWILPNLPYSGVVRNLAKQCMVNQRFQGRFNTNIFEGATPQTIGNTLSAQKQNELSAIQDEYSAPKNNAQNLNLTLQALMESVPTVTNGKNIVIHGIEL